jgi:hypothetical protein
MKRYEKDTYYSETLGYYFKIFDNYFQKHIGDTYDDEELIIDDIDEMNDWEELDNGRMYG